MAIRHKKGEKRVGMDVEKLEPVQGGGSRKACKPPGQRAWLFLDKLHMELALDPTVSLLGIYL